MKRYLFIVVISFFIYMEPIFCQHENSYQSGFEDCSGKVVWITKSWKRFPEIDYDRFLGRYFYKTPSNGLEYRYDDTSTFIKFKEEVKFSNFIAFVGKVNNADINLKIFLSKKRYKINSSLYDVEKMVMKDTQYWTTYPLELEKAIGHGYYGLPPEDSILDIFFIDSIKIYTGGKAILIKDDIFGKLCNPNISDHYRSYKPIEVYYYPKKERIYIYVMGQINSLNLDWNGEENFEPDLFDNLNSYISKIIINPADNSDVRNITVPGFYLWSYGWPRCADFWAF